MPNDIAKDLIRLAADMARGTGLPSEYDDDHLPDRPRRYWLNLLSGMADKMRAYALLIRAGRDEIESLRSRLTDAEREARVLVVAMADKCGAPDNWKPLPDAAGMITQISNMVAGLREERALIVQRAENAEAALVAEVAKNGRHAMRVTIAQLEARLQKVMARCADLLDEDQFNELDAIASSASGVQYKPCEICTTQSWCETHGCQCYPTEAMCCVDYPRCDCNSPPEPDDEWHCSQYPGCECFTGCREKALEAAP